MELVINFVLVLSGILSFLILIRVFMSWIPGGFGPVREFIHETTEPIMGLVRKIPHRAGMLDLSPIIALIGLDLVTRLIISILASL